ncbi:dTDP-glucose 4,6-dehydratase [Candidatus Peregrinibacteria bacterium]|nr:dTDP-glucose 4,6-dehydratase [Candidatus Peregrinibacteria bacterium]
MNLLITGGAGFIGSHFTLRHCKANPRDTVVVLDKLTYAADKTLLDPVAGMMTFVEGDIADQALVGRIVEDFKIDTIINFAAESHVDNSINDATPFLHTNVIGTQALLEVVKTHPKVRLLHISTDEVFGDIDDAMAPCKSGDALFPSSPYAASKAAAEMLVMAAMRTFRIHACITRCTNNYGPHQAAEKFIPTVIRHALKDEKIPVYGDGRNKRDWLYVTDHCDALETIIATPWAFWDPKVPSTNPRHEPGSGHIFHVSANEEQENIAVAKMILDILGKPHSLLSYVEDRLGHDWRYALDSENTRKLGWKPKVSFEEGLKQTVEWYRAKRV